MSQNDYTDQLGRRPCDIDLDFWRRPEGVSVPDDDLSFLLIPDAVEAAAVDDVAGQVHRYQTDSQNSNEQITRALIVTMGGMLPGVLLYDHLVEGRMPNTPKIDFGTVGVSLYAGPGVRYESPKIQRELSIPIANEVVLLIDDLGDVGGTMTFLRATLKEQGARKVLGLAIYMKPAAKENCCADFYFGETQQDTWIITPRDRVETLVKRVPVWKERGASQQECRRRLVEIIGYPEALVDSYLTRVFIQAP